MIGKSVTFSIGIPHVMGTVGRWERRCGLSFAMHWRDRSENCLCLFNQQSPIGNRQSAIGNLPSRWLTSQSAPLVAVLGEEVVGFLGSPGSGDELGHGGRGVGLVPGVFDVVDELPGFFDFVASGEEGGVA